MESCHCALGNYHLSYCDESKDNTKQPAYSTAFIIEDIICTFKQSLTESLDAAKVKVPPRRAELRSEIRIWTCPKEREIHFKIKKSAVGLFEGTHPKQFCVEALLTEHLVTEKR